MRLNRDHEHLAKLRNYYARHQILPSFSSITELLGISSKASVSEMVKHMKQRGYLELSPDRRLQRGPRFFEAVLLDTVQAGSPEPASDIQPTGIDIARRLLKTPSKSVLLKVTGNSMVDAGLLDGDYVIVERGLKPAIGDIVVAVVDRDYTIKEWAKDDNGPYLKPANKRYKDIRPNESLEIFGVVTGSFRSYNPRHAA